MTAGVDGSVEPDDAALDNLRDRRPGVFGDGVPVPAVDQGVRGEDNVGSRNRSAPRTPDRSSWSGSFSKPTSLPGPASRLTDTRGRRLHTLAHFSGTRRMGRWWDFLYISAVLLKKN